MNPKWLSNQKNGVVLNLYIQPGASKSEISGEHGGRLKVKIKAQPRDGEANEELIAFISKTISLPKSKITILRGESSRQKDVFLETLDSQSVIKKITKIENRKCT